jgi:hypothetical protein
MKSRAIGWLIFWVYVLVSIFEVQAASKPVAMTDAIFNLTDQSGCISTEVFVFARDGDPRRAASTGEISLRFSQFDDCDETPVTGISGTVPLGAQDLKVNGKSGLASLKTTLKLLDTYSEKTVNVFLHLTWKSTEDSTKNATRQFMQRPGEFVDLRKSFSQTDRSATAQGFILVGNTRFELKTPLASIATIIGN